VRSHVDALVREALTDAIEGGLFRVRTVPAYAVHAPADPAFGDLTCDVAMVLARQTGRSPYAIAGVLLDRLRDRGGWLDGVEVGGPGFVNFRFGSDFWRMLLEEAVVAGPAFGRSGAGRGRPARVLSVGAAPGSGSSPTEGRRDVVADSVARLLAASGWKVERGTTAAPGQGIPLALVHVALVDVDDHATSAAADPAVPRVVPVGDVRLTRAGEAMPAAAVAWSDVVQEIGEDAARFFVLRGAAGDPVELDLEQARRGGANSPLSRVRLAHDRLACVLHAAGAAGEEAAPHVDLALLGETEHEVLRLVVEWPDVVERAAHLLEPHHVVAHVLALAGAVHRYYNRHRMLIADRARMPARLALVRCARHVLGGALELCAVTTAGRM
jgi:arginyl-tRNA synthetase